MSGTVGPIKLDSWRPGVPPREWHHSQRVEGRQTHLVQINGAIYAYGPQIRRGAEASFHMGVRLDGERCGIRSVPLRGPGRDFAACKAKVRGEIRAQNAVQSKMLPYLWLVCDVAADDGESTTQTALEFMPLGHSDLAQISRDHRATAADVYDFLLQLSAELSKSHRLGYAHGDVKLANIVLCEIGELRLIDWSRAVALTSSDAVDAHGQNPLFMSPELLQGISASAAAPTDMWMLGLGCLALLFQQLPLQKDVFEHLAKDPPMGPAAVQLYIRDVALRAFETVRRTNQVPADGQDWARAWPAMWQETESILGAPLAAIVRGLLAAEPSERLTAPAVAAKLATMKRPDGPPVWAMLRPGPADQLLQLERDRDFLLQYLQPAASVRPAPAVSPPPAQATSIRPAPATSIRPAPAATAVARPRASAPRINSPHAHSVRPPVPRKRWSAAIGAGVGVMVGSWVTAVAMSIAYYVLPWIVAPWVFYSSPLLGLAAGFKMARWYYGREPNRRSQ